MEAQIDILFKIAIGLVGITALILLYFVVLQLIKILGDLVNSDSLQNKMVELSDKSVQGLLNMFHKGKFVLVALFGLLVVIYGFANYKSVMKPINFNIEKNERYDAAKERLVEIREAQKAYKAVYGKYAASFDTLLHFIENDSFPVVTKIGAVDDSLVLEHGSVTKAEKIALEKGLIKRDTTMKSVLDSLFKAKRYVLDSMRYVPYRNGSVEFEIGAKMLESGSGLKVPVMEVKVHNNELLHGMDEQLIINFNEERQAKTGYPGLKIGSLNKTTNNSGNWE